MFSPGICWSGLILNLCGSEVQALQMNSYGVRPLRVLRRLAKLLGVDEVAQMSSQLIVGLVEVAFNGCVLDRAVHSFDLPIGPWMLGLCQPVIDVVLGAGVFEGVRPNGLSSLQGGLDVRRRRARIAWVVKWVPLSVRTVWTL